MINQQHICPDCGRDFSRELDMDLRGQPCPSDDCPSNEGPGLNLAPNLPMTLVRERVKNAQILLSGLQLAMSEPGFDKNDATGILGSALGILDSLLIKPKEGK